MGKRIERTLEELDYALGEILGEPKPLSKGEIEKEKLLEKLEAKSVRSREYLKKRMKENPDAIIRKLDPRTATRLLKAVFLNDSLADDVIVERYAQGWEETENYEAQY